MKRIIAGHIDTGLKPHRPLSPKMEVLLRNGTDGEPMQDYMSVILSMEQHRWSTRSQVKALRNPANRAGFWYRKTTQKHGRDAAAAELRSMQAKARLFIANHPAAGDRPDALTRVAEIREAADSTLWPGRTGSTDRVVLEALLRMATLGGGPVFRASQRQIVQEANVNRRTVANALARLQESGWLTQARAATADQGTTWQVRAVTSVTAPVPLARERMTTGVITLALLAAHDAFARGCLGGSGARVLAALLGSVDPLTAAEVAGDLGVSPSTVRLRLRQMGSAAVVEVLSDGTWRPLTRDLGALLERLTVLAAWRGTDGRGERIKEQHEREREQYADRLGHKKRQRLGVLAGGRSGGMLSPGSRVSASGTGTRAVRKQA